MAETDEPLSLLNVFEIEDEDGTHRHLICFLDAVLAGSVGIDDRSVVGDFRPGPDGEFDPDTFRPNPAFGEAAGRFLDVQASRAPEIDAAARANPGARLDLVDPRYHPGTDPDDEPSDDEVLGSFAVDDEGRLVPDSFRYNADHVWFHPESGPSALLNDRRFYEWLHPEARPKS